MGGDKKIISKLNLIVKKININNIWMTNEKVFLNEKDICFCARKIKRQ